MRLYTILLVVVGILAFLTGISVFAGSRKNERKTTKFYLLGTICILFWCASCALFLELQPEQADLAPFAILGIYISGAFLCWAIFSQLSWTYKLGRIVSVILGCGGLLLSGALIANPSILYTGITVSSAGNSITVTDGWYYITYASFQCLTAGAMLFMLLFRIKKTRNKGVRNGYLALLLGVSVAAPLSLIFNVILPPTRYDLIWVGPIAQASSVIAFYYAILRFRTIQLSSKWLKAVSYVVIMCTAAIIYMVIFYVIFTALFKVANPSPSIFILNFIMITIVLLLFPVLSELSAFIRSLIHTNQVDLAYIVKKLNSMTTNVNLNELSEFLADHMHFAYIGIIVNGKLYGSSALPLSAAELKEITHLKKPLEAGGIWQEIPAEKNELFGRIEIKAVAELNDAKGKPFGQILVGKPLGKMGFERRDLIQLEMIINLVAAMIDTKAK